MRTVLLMSLGPSARQTGIRDCLTPDGMSPNGGELQDRMLTGGCSRSGTAMLAAEMPLGGSRVLIVEDRYILADGVRAAILQAGGEVVGPYASVKEAWRGLQAHPVDLAVLDIHLHDGDVFEIAEKLERSEISWVFATGYGADKIPLRWRHLPSLMKPFSDRDIVTALVRLSASSKSN